MKKTVLMLIAAFTFTCVAAQSDRRRGGRDGQHPDRTELMVKELGLNEEQAEKLKELNEKYPQTPFQRGQRGPRAGSRPQVDGETGATSQAQERPQRPSREEMEKRFEERRKQQEAYDNELKEILTEEQFKAYKKRQEEMRNNRPGRNN